jgi:hypothetical protein
VLSKAPFFFNSRWEPLHRDVENLGPYYYLYTHLRRHVFSEKKDNDDQELWQVIDDEVQLSFLTINQLSYSLIYIRLNVTFQMIKMEELTES